MVDGLSLTAFMNVYAEERDYMRKEFQQFRSERREQLWQWRAECEEEFQQWKQQLEVLTVW